MSFHEDIFLRFYSFELCGRIQYYRVDVVLRLVYSWQSVMTTTFDVITFAPEYFLPPPSGDESQKHLIDCYSRILLFLKREQVKNPHQTHNYVWYMC